jgi:hypothetical protein
LAPAGPGIDDWRGLSEGLSRLEHVRAVCPFVTGVGQAETKLYRFQCLLRGINLDCERAGGGLSEYLSAPRLSGGFAFGPRSGTAPARALVGRRIAQKMEVAKGDYAKVTVQQRDNPERNAKIVLKISGEVATGSLFVDNNVFVSLGDAQSVFGIGDRVTGLAVWLDDIRLAERIRTQIALAVLARSKITLDEKERELFAQLSALPRSTGEVAQSAGIPAAETLRLLTSLVRKGAARELQQQPGHYVASTEPQVKTSAEGMAGILRSVAEECKLFAPAVLKDNAELFRAAGVAVDE